MSKYYAIHPRLIEAINQMTVEEMVVALADLASYLATDRLRDLGPSRVIHGNEDFPTRPGAQGWIALVDAVESADYPCPGFVRDSKEAMHDLFEDATDEEAMQYSKEMYDYMEHVGATMRDMQEQTYETYFHTVMMEEMASAIGEEMAVAIIDLSKDAEDAPDEAVENADDEFGGFVTPAEDEPEDDPQFGWD